MTTVPAVGIVGRRIVSRSHWHGSRGKNVREPGSLGAQSHGSARIGASGREAPRELIWEGLLTRRGDSRLETGYGCELWESRIKHMHLR